ncbi:MAG: four-carbon acid sugar kinase family protein, partial [Pyrinomonadaceae bacterium]|nr:four-carbon acid sugar kinase family protein [Pyrinomonadaceae bacterium]
LPFVPAYPKLRRTTRDGYHYVGDELLHQTAFGRDPLEPIEESYIPAILKQQTTIQIKVVPCASEQIQSDANVFNGDGIYVLDATTDEELRQAGELLKNRGLLKAVAGSAGFAEWLPDLLDLEKRPAKRPRSGGNMLVISGSVNEISLKQLSHAEANGFVAVTLPPEVLVSENGVQSPCALSAIARITELDEQRKNVILRSIEKFEDIEECLRLGRRLGVDVKHLHLRIAENLGQIAGQVLKRCGFKIVTVFGGDTLVAMVRALGWSGLLPWDEILPGITVSEVAGGEDELLLITKAGGFGEGDALSRIKDLLRSTG